MVTEIGAQKSSKTQYKGDARNHCFGILMLIYSIRIYGTIPHYQNTMLYHQDPVGPYEAPKRCRLEVQSLDPATMRGIYVLLYFYMYMFIFI